MYTTTRSSPAHKLEGIATDPVLLLLSHNSALRAKETGARQDYVTDRKETW